MYPRAHAVDGVDDPLDRDASMSDRFRLEGRPNAIRSAERRIAACWGITALAALALAGLYIAGGQPQVEGALLFVALLFLGLGFVAFARDLLPGSNVTGSRGELPSTEAEREAAQAAFDRGEEPFVRRSFLLRMLLLAGGALVGSSGLDGSTHGARRALCIVPYTQ